MSTTTNQAWYNSHLANCIGDALGIIAGGVAVALVIKATAKALKECPESKDVLIAVAKIAPDIIKCWSTARCKNQGA